MPRSQGFVPSERDIMPVLDAVFLRAEGRIIVASFASHVHRIQQIIDMAALHDRKIAFVGRSMVRNMGIARDLGYLKIPGGMLVASDDLANDAGRRGGPHLHRLAGRADGGALPDREPRPRDQRRAE